MSFHALRSVAVIALLALLSTSFFSRRSFSCTAVAVAGEKSEAKPAPVLPKDPEAIVLTFDPGPNGIKRQGPAPYLKIQADGRVSVTNWLDGVKKESKLTAKELEDLLRFVLEKNDFFSVTAGKITDAIAKEQAKGAAVALGGVGTPVISVHANGKRHEVSYRGALEYQRLYPKIGSLAQFVAIQNRLASLAEAVLKGMK